MLALCLACAISVTGIRAQSNTEYSFRQQSVADGQSYGETGGTGTGDPVPVLSMDCLAANGYGQWTLSSSAGQGTNGATTYPAGWYLLANGLYTPSTHYDAAAHDPTLLTNHPECIPPGVVQNAALAGGAVPTEPKATTNLDGAASYVWPAAARTTFVVQGFRAPDVDLSFSFLSNPNPPMNIIASTIHAYPAVSTEQPVGTFHNVVSAAPYQDEFDVACDAAYLYVTWCSTTNLSPGIVGSEIWATVVDLNTMAVQPGFPMSLGQGERPTIACDPRNNRTGTTPSFEVAYLTGQTLPSGIIVKKWNGTSMTTIPLATQYIPPGCPPAVPYNFVTHARILVSSVFAGGAVQATTDAVYAIVNYVEPHDPVTRGKGTGTLATPSGLGLVEYQQVLPGVAANYVDGMLVTPELPVQPDIWVVAPQGWPILDHPIVALSNPYDEQDYPGAPFNQFHCLYQYDESARTSSLPLLIVRGDDNGSCGTTDERMVMDQVYPVPTPAQVLPDNPVSYCAAVNQMGIHVHWRTSSGLHYYSRDTSRAFDEDIDENTLVTDICTLRSGTSHGGTAGAKILENKTMAVWTDPNYGFSLTNPNYGLYQPRTYGTSTAPVNIDPHVGMLNFVDENVALCVGQPLGQYVPGTAANLTNMPYFYFNFLGSNRGSTQSVIVNGTWNYYGLVEVHDPTTLAPTLIGTPFTNGTLNWDNWVFPGLPVTNVPCETGGGNIQIGTSWQDVEGTVTDVPGTLIVHGGANFVCGEWTQFSITPDGNEFAGNIDVLYGGDVFPINNASFNTYDTTGTMTLDGQTVLKRNARIASTDTSTWWNAGGCLRGHIPYFLGASPQINQQAVDVIMRVGEVWDAGDHSGTTAFDAENFDFYNTSAYYPGGKSEIRIGESDPDYSAPDIADGGDVTFNGGDADAIEIHMVDPDPKVVDGTHFNAVNYTVENMTFNDLRGYVILLESDQLPQYYDFYGHILISNNTFGGWSDHVGAPLYPNLEDFPVYGIYARNFNSEAYYAEGYGAFSQLGPIDIEGNQFTSSNYTTIGTAGNPVDDDDAAVSAIVLENTTANVESNKITDGGYNVGINIWPTALSGLVVDSYSLLCTNDIENLQLVPPYYTSPLACGIKSSYGWGYIKSNTLKNDDIGYWGTLSDNPHPIFNSITSYTHFGVDAKGGSVIDMTGVHGGGNDYAAYDTVKGPSADIAAGYPWLLNIEDGSSNILVGSLGGYSNWAHNNFVSTATGSSPTIFGANATVNLGNIDYNFWGTGVDPANGGSGTFTCTNCSWATGKRMRRRAVLIPLHILPIPQIHSQVGNQHPTFHVVLVGAGDKPQSGRTLSLLMIISIRRNLA